MTVTLSILDAWKCYTFNCGYIDKEEEFKTENGHICPKCKSEDVFPHRLFKCKKCGEIAEQVVWFPDSLGDEDPLEEKEESIQCEFCFNKAKWDEEVLEHAELIRVPTLIKVKESKVKKNDHLI